MWEDILGQLTKLSKEQLIYIIEQYRKATLRMSNALVRESMCYIHSTDACDIIRAVSYTHLDVYKRQPKG